MRRTIATIALLLIATGARSQVAQTSVRLNDPALANQYLSVPVKTGLQGTDAYTLEAWVYPTSYTNFPTIIGNDFTTGYWLGLTTTGSIRFYPRGGQWVDTAVPVPLNTWSHVAATYDPASGWAIYLNGASVSTGATITGPATTSTGDLRIGADRSGATTTYFWRGNLDEVRIWQGVARTAAQIRETMYAGVGRPYLHSSLYADLQGCWDMQNPFTTQAFDRASGIGVLYNGADFMGGGAVELLSTNGPPVAFNVGVEFNGFDTYSPMAIGDGFANGLTIEAWVCPYSFAGFPTIVGRNYQQSFWLGLNGSGVVRFYPRGGVSQYFEGTFPLTLNQFNHVAATYRDGLASIYVDGMLQRSVTTFTGPVGENGRRPWVGADTSAAGPAFPFEGILDEVRVTQGALSSVQIRRDIFRGATGSLLTILDEGGIARPSDVASFDGMGGDEVFGTNARLVRSSAPMFPIGTLGFSSRNPGDARSDVAGGFGLVPPETFTSSSLGTDLLIPENVIISDLDVFLSAATQDLAAVTVDIRSPDATTIQLVAPGAAHGRDLQTIFDDESANTLATGVQAYVAGVAPSQSLSAFDGQHSNGYWRITMSGSSAARVALNAWGLRFNSLTVDAPGPAATRELRLRATGGTIVRGQGQLELSLPHDADVRLDLLDVQGRLGRELMSGPQRAGDFRVGWNAEGLAPGVYFARLTVDRGESRSVRVIVMK